MPLLLCPNCQIGMQEVNRSDVQIDVCTNCRGVWLDRGELEKLLGSIQETEKEWQQEREGATSGNVRSKDEEYRQRHSQEHSYDNPKEEHYSRAGGYRGYHKKSTFERLKNIFD